MKRTFLILLMLFSPAIMAETNEQRAQDLYGSLLCPVCDGQVLAESDADVAVAMRAIIRERLSKGDSNDEIVAVLQSRYGNGILLKPPFNPTTWGLWFLPFFILLMGGFGILFYFKGSAKVSNIK